MRFEAVKHPAIRAHQLQKTIGLLQQDTAEPRYAIANFLSRYDQPPLRSWRENSIANMGLAPSFRQFELSDKIDRSKITAELKRGIL